MVWIDVKKAGPGRYGPLTTFTSVTTKVCRHWSMTDR
jgi:hypothetical protein